jgi:hypothetical protein
MKVSLKVKLLTAGLWPELIIGFSKIIFNLRLLNFNHHFSKNAEKFK